MSILARYRKPGGFRQLLKLIETSGPSKQSQLIAVIEKEDPNWAELIRQKKITPEMILSWELEHLATILENMNIRHSSCLIKVMEKEKRTDLSRMIREEKYREIKDIVLNMDEPLPVELTAAYNHLLETMRYLDEEKKINLRFIDPALDLSEAA